MKQLNSGLLKAELSPEQRIAFIMSPRLGDSLLSMVVVNNLVRNNFNVTVFGNFLYDLNNWFPWIKIQSCPTVDQARSIFSTFDILIHAYPTDVIDNASSWHPAVYVLDHSPWYRQKIAMPDIQVDICHHELQLKNIVRTNNIQVPPDLQFRQNQKRIVIHPTSNHELREWLPQRFVALAKQLQQQGWQPEFIVSPNERSQWEWVVNEGIPLPKFASMDAVARWIYESGWFIGNDSGIGHLASNLGIATVTMGVRPSMLRRWRPSWAPGIVLLPPSWLITRPLKEKFWKYTISVDQVLRAFTTIQLEISQKNTDHHYVTLDVPS